MFHYKVSKHTVFISIITLICLICVGCTAPVSDNDGFISEPESIETSPIGDRYLKITVTPSEEVACGTFSSGELGGNFTHGMGYRHVTNVTIELNDCDVPLEDALRDNSITENEILFYARQDSAQGICIQSQQSLHGLTHIRFSYPEFDLCITYDIYETPDGQQHLISDMYIHAPETVQGHHIDYYNENHQRLDREDWGLSFNILDVTDSGIKLQCTQSGGQQIGELQIGWFYLTMSGEYIDSSTNEWLTESDYILIPENTTTEIYLDLSKSYGELPDGTDGIVLFVHDIFDEEQVHPLMMDYHDLQSYVIEFNNP